MIQYKFHTGISAVIFSLFMVCGAALAAEAEITFNKEFVPDVIGPDSVSALTFTIVSYDASPLDELAFTDTLPAGMVLAAPAFVSNTCFGTVTAPDGGTTITLADGMLGASASCEIVVNVTAPAIDNSDTNYLNVTGALTWFEGENGSAVDELDVDINRPGFSKNFAPSTVEIGGRSTLTFTIDNSLNPAPATFLSFIDNLPVGMVIAGPANASTNCQTAPLVATLIAVPGTTVISLSSFGDASFPPVGDEDTCTVTVDVIGGSVGSLGNVSEPLDATIGDTLVSGKAAAVLEVTEILELLELSKEFTDDPVLPGGTVTLEFTVLNKSRDFAATGISFDDSLETVLAGLAPTLPPLPDPPCGAGSSLTFGLGVLSLSGGSLPPEGSCTFSVTLIVPASSSPGAYPNATSSVTGTIDGTAETGNAAGDLLFVSDGPLFTKEFIDDPVGAGGSATLRFTITNLDSASGLTGIEFTDDLNTAILGLAANGLVSGLDPLPLIDPCGTGSELTIFDLNDNGFTTPPFPNYPPDPTMLEFTGGGLAAAGMPGDSCSFDVVVDVPAIASSGTYVNTTSTLTSASKGAAAASDELEVVGAPRLTKLFSDDPVLPGGTVTLEFTLRHSAEAGADATGISFTDDLTTLIPAIAGLTASSLGPNTCSLSTVDISTPTLIDFSGGTLIPGEECSFSVTLSVPLTATPGGHLNTTSVVSATVGGLPAKSIQAVDNLDVVGLTLSKEFIDDPVIPGGNVTLRFTLENAGLTDATAIFFTDELADVLQGPPDLTIVTALPLAACGGTLSSIGTGLVFTGGSQLAGAPACTFDVILTVPAGTDEGTYKNVTSEVLSSHGIGQIAADSLEVSSTLLELTKEFTDDPVNPGAFGHILKFTITNLSTTDTVTDIAFSDDLDAALSGLRNHGAIDDTCFGASIGTPGFINYTGITLGPAASCQLLLIISVPAGPLAGNLFPNTTSAVTGLAGGLAVFGEPASDTLVVNTVNQSKSFGGSIAATGSQTLSFTITNVDSGSGVTDLSLTDDLNAVLTELVATGLPANDVCGTGSTISGSSFLSLTGASLAAAGSPGDSCTINITVQAPLVAAPGVYVNTTSSLFRFGLPVAAPAKANLTVEPPPTFSKVFSPDSILFTGVSTLTFTINNSASGLAASSLSFTDNFPAGIVIADPTNASTTCAGGMGDASPGAGSFNFAGASVGANASCTVQLDVTGAAEGPQVNTTLDLTSSSGNSGTATDTITILPETDLTLTKTDSVDPVIAGNNLTYTVTAANVGPSDAQDVVVTDTLPAGVTFVSTTGCAEDPAGVATCSLGTITAGNSKQYTITVSVDSDTSGTITNMASVASSTPLINTGDDSASEDTSVNAEADLTLTKTDSVDPVIAGNNLTYAVTAANAGPSDAQGVVVTDTLPAGVTLVSTTGCAEDPAGVATCSLGTITAGNSKQYTITVSVDSDTSGTITNMASVASTTPLVNTGDDSASEDTFVNVEADLSVTKTDGLTEAVPGQTTVTYTIVASNIGPSDAPSVVLSDTLPADLTCTFTSVALGGASGHTVAGAGNLAENLSLPAGSSVTYSVDCDIDPSATGTLSNTATISGPVPVMSVAKDSNNSVINRSGNSATQADNNNGNNSATDDNTVLTPEAGLSITKSSGKTSTFFGGHLTYTMVVTNHGPSDSSGGTISDALPAGLEFVSSASGCTEAAGIVTCSFGPLSNGSSVELTFVALVVTNTADTIVNIVSVTGNETNPLAGNNTASDSTTIVPIFAPIPTLSGWMLLLMTFLFAGLGTRFVRKEF